MTNPAHLSANKSTVRDYLNVAYLATPQEVNAAIVRHLEIVEDAERFRSHAYYAGDKIATAEGWTENAAFDIDEEDEEEDD